MKQYALDTSTLPNVWVTWDTTKNGHFNGRYWLDCQTGKKKDTPETWMYYRDESSFTHRAPWNATGRIGLNYYTCNNPNIWLRSNSRPYMMYAKYHADIDRLELAVVTIDTSRKETARKWEYAGTRMFIGKDKSVINECGMPLDNNDLLYRQHYAYNPKDAISIALRLDCNRENVVREFKKFIGAECFTIGNGSSIKITYPWHIKRWYETVQKERSTGKQQKLTDELVAMPLCDTTGFEYKYPIRTYDDGSYFNVYEMSGIVYFERIDNGWSVLRSFYRTDKNQLVEEWRMYINDDGRNRVVSASNGDWVPSNQVRTRWRNYSYLANPADAVEKCNRIKYILQSTDTVDETHKVDFLVTALRFPEIEQLIKLGYSQQAISITRSNTPKAGIKHLFGGYYNDKEKNLLRKIGMTKYQFDTYLCSEDNRGYYSESQRALAMMRKMFGGDLSALDTVSFDKYFAELLVMARSSFGRIDQYMKNLDLNEMRFLKNLVRLGEKNRAAYGLAYDTMSDYCRLNAVTAPAVDWYFDNYSDLVRIHDAVTELKRMQDAERRAMWNQAEAERLKREEKKREELDEKRKVYEYEDDNYIIRLPETLSEIVAEGSAQRICIGGYTSRHANGGTNLFFLREKSAPDVPFYAIEMSNSKNIVQIHGYCNQWLGNDPDAIPTVIRWLRKNGIKCEDNILTCKATGYCSCNDYVPMPVVD